MQPKAISSIPPRAPRMVLGAVTRGKVEAPLRLLVSGVEGVGKTSFAAASPSPIFLGAEDGSNQLDVARFPLPESWEDVLEAIRTLTTERHEYKTLVVDTLDSIEPLCWRKICQRDGKETPESYGYGKGYVVALEEWRVFLAALERLRAARGMAVILLAHVVIKPFKNPEGDDYDRYQLKIHDKAGGLIKEWTDANLFAQFEAFAKKGKGELKAKGVSTGARVVKTTRTAAYDAKNRFDLPEELPLDWPTVMEAIAAHRPADPAKLRESIAGYLGQVDEAVATKAKEAMAAAGEDAAQLAKINNRLAALAGEGKA